MIDIVIVAILVFFTVLGWKRGLIRTLTELLAVVLALTLSTHIAKAAAPVIVDQALRPTVYAMIEDRVDEVMDDLGPELSPAAALEQVVEAIPNRLIREHAQHLLDGVDAAADEALVPTRHYLAEAGKDVADTVLDGVVRDLIQSVLCTACFIILTVLFRLAARMLRMAEKLPGIRQLNELGGALLGLGKGLILVCLLLWVLRLTGIMTAEMADGSFLMGLASQWTGGALG